MSIPGDEVHEIKCVPTPAQLQVLDLTVPWGDRDMSGTCCGPCTHHSTCPAAFPGPDISAPWGSEAISNAGKPNFWNTSAKGMAGGRNERAEKCPASKNPQSLCWACRNSVPGSPSARDKHYPIPNPSTSQGIADNMPQLLIYYKICTRSIQNNIDCLWRLWGLHTDVMYQQINWNLMAYFICWSC